MDSKVQVSQNICSWTLIQMIENREIMRDNMLVNMTGLEGHWMPTDLNIEHLIKFLKVGFIDDYELLTGYILNK